MKTLYFSLFLFYTSAFGLNSIDEDIDDVLTDRAMKVYDGEESSYKQQKHMVNLRIEITTFEGKQFTGYCSASVISEWWLVTAAHCFKTKYDDNIFDLKAYITRIENDEMVYLGTSLINDIITHPKYVHNYDFPKSQNDIALMKTVEPMKLSSDLVPIRLHQTPVKQATVATISGYGMSEYGSLLPRQGLVSVKACPEWIGSKLLCSFSFVRAGFGDSGGPLVSKKGTLLGVTSAGCDPPHHERKSCETIFVQIYYYLDWINTVTGV